ncbi:omega-amidase NIT2, partial [Striga asiatica]
MKLNTPSPKCNGISCHGEICTQNKSSRKNTRRLFCPDDLLLLLKRKLRLRGFPLSGALESRLPEMAWPADAITLVAAIFVDERESSVGRICSSSTRGLKRKNVKKLKDRTHNPPLVRGKQGAIGEGHFP